MKKGLKRGLTVVGFLFMIGAFMAFIVALYAGLLYFFEGETIKFPEMSWSNFVNVFKGLPDPKQTIDEIKDFLPNDGNSSKPESAPTSEGEPTAKADWYQSISSKNPSNSEMMFFYNNI